MKTDIPVGADPSQRSEIMSIFGVRHLAVLLCAGLLTAAGTSAQAQGSNPDQKASEQKSAPAGDNAKGEAEKKKIDVIAEAARRLTGPAANPECTWIGVRVARLLWQDDLDTAFRHLDVYDRFGCPGNHIQATFRCLARQPDLNPKATETITNRVNECWLDPTGASAAQGAAPAAAAAPGAPATPPAPAATNGTTAR